jgi:hypothetical protein
MKEIEEPLKKLLPEVEINQQIEKEKHYRLIGSMAVKRGHKLYAVKYDDYNRPEGVSIASIEIPTLQLHTDRSVTGKKRVYFTEKTFYTSALNPENAVKHYLRELEQIKRKRVK